MRLIARIAPQMIGLGVLLAPWVGALGQTTRLGSPPGYSYPTPPDQTPPVVAPTPDPGSVTPLPTPMPTPTLPYPCPPGGGPRPPYPGYPYPPPWIYPPIIVGPPIPVPYPVPYPYPVPVSEPPGWGFGQGDPLAFPAPQPAVRRVRTVRRLVVNQERADERLLVGDRLFRAGNLSRAVERYEQAADADPTSGEPLVRLAQVAVAREDYGEAANRLREAQATEPGWMLNAEDVQNLFGDPVDFAATLKAIEAHIRANPNDRNARLVLGAELYLSGRTAEAADVFRKLADRKPDSILAAFLDASRATP